MEQFHIGDVLSISTRVKQEVKTMLQTISTVYKRLRVSLRRITQRLHGKLRHVDATHFQWLVKIWDGYGWVPIGNITDFRLDEGVNACLHENAIFVNWNIDSRDVGQCLVQDAWIRMLVNPHPQQAPRNIRLYASLGHKEWRGTVRKVYAKGFTFDFDPTFKPSRFGPAVNQEEEL